MSSSKNLYVSRGKSVGELELKMFRVVTVPGELGEFVVHDFNEHFFIYQSLKRDW